MDQTSHVKSALAHLEKLQENNGSFRSVTNKYDKNGKLRGREKHTTIFYSAIVLASLNCIYRTASLSKKYCDGEIQEKIKRMREKIARFLLLERSGDWTFNYWTRGSAESKQMPYPNDLDDTALVLRTLVEYKQELVPPEALACFTRALVCAEKSPGGPYYTWLVLKENANFKNDIDPVINGNILRFLRAIKVEMPELSKFVESELKEGRLKSPYYNERWLPMYLMFGAKDLNEQNHAAKGEDNVPLIVERICKGFVYIKAIVRH
ncbi:MAG: hypothetical protein V1489_02685 [Candidatus Liptonbacteria bacterium]